MRFELYFGGWDGLYSDGLGIVFYDLGGCNVL